MIRPFRAWYDHGGAKKTMKMSTETRRRCAAGGASWALLALTLWLSADASARAQGRRAPRPATHGGLLVRQDFNKPDAWPQLSASSSAGVTAHAARGPVGTVDVANTATPSGGVLLTAQPTRGGAWNASLISGLLPVHNTVASLGKLTLSFSLSASAARPVTVCITSFDAARRRTGALSGLIYPAAPDFFQRYALDLSALNPFGVGRFQPTAPWVEFTFGMGGAGARGTCRLRLDNVNYAGPAYYVSPHGSDSGDGRSERTAFATPQRALDIAQPGDIVLLMGGTYKAGLVPVASFPRPGAPDAWIVLKNYPGQRPTLTSNGWNIVSIAKGSSSAISHDPPLAYLEVRGLHVRGEGDVAKREYPEAMNKPDPRTNSNGIAIDGRYSAATFHHIRIADNLVEFSPGAGIGSIDGDWMTVENNVCRSNCWTTIYAPSGISVMGSANFDATVNIYKRLVRNNVCCHNQTYEKWASFGDYSDGNGIILDVNQGSDAHPTSKYTGRTLVQSNLSYDNGGSGIHTVTADRVDIINNTVYLNSASVHLEYGAIFTYGSDDVRIMNNIMVAPVANIAAGEKPEPVNRLNGKNTRVIFSHNLYSGGNIAPTLGVGDVVGDPRFVKPSIDDTLADFHLRPGSPAIGKGTLAPFSPILDLDGKTRGNTPSEGAYEKTMADDHSPR